MNKCEYCINDIDNILCNKEANHTIETNKKNKNYCEEHYHKILYLMGFGRTAGLIDENLRYKNNT